MNGSVSKWLCLVSVLIIAAGLHSPLRADEGRQPVRLDEVVVTATRTVEDLRRIPANVSVITTGDIERSGATSIAEVLERQGNVIIRSYSGNPADAMVDIRGMGGENPFGKVLIMLDGRRMNRPDMAPINWLQVPLATVERIEVVRGSGSVLYGDAAVSGVINILTKTGEGPPVPEASVMFGSHGLRNTRLGVSGSEGRISYNLAGEHLKTFGYRDRSTFSSTGAAFNLGYDASDRFRVSLGLSFNETDYELPGTLTRAEMAVNRRQFQPSAWPGVLPAHDRDEASDTYVNIDARIDTVLGDYGEFSVGVAYGSKDLVMDIHPWADFSGYDMGTLAVTPRYILDSTIGPFANKLILGLDYYDDTMEVEKFSSVHRTARTHAVDFKKRSLGFYVRDEFSILPSLIISAGFRRERASVTGSYRDSADPSVRFEENRKVHRGTAWEAGITWLFREMSNAFVRSGTFYRYPFLDEQANYHFAPVRFLTDLEQERGYSYEAGARIFLLDKRLRVSMTVYLIDMQDQIVYVGVFPFGQNRNVEKTRHKGLELSARYQLQEVFRLEGNATFSRAAFREGQHSGKELPMTPRSTAYLALELFLPLDLVLRPEVHRVGDAFLLNDFNNTAEKLAGRTVGNLYLYYRPRSDRRELSAFIGIENISDEDYATAGMDNAPWADSTYYPAPGRTVKGGLSVRF